MRTSSVMYTHQRELPEVNKLHYCIPYRKKTGSKGELYVIEDGSGEDNPKKEDASNISGVPWHLWAKMAPPIYETKYGFNLFTRAGILGEVVVFIFSIIID